MGTCFRCLDNLCGACINWEFGRTFCPTCAPLVLRRQARLRLGVLLAVAVGFGVGAIAVSRRHGVTLPYGVPPSLDDYGGHAETLRSLSERLGREPCERAWIVELGEVLVRAGDARAAISAGERFFELCGEHERLRWVTHHARNRISDWAGADADATVLLQLDPADKDYWWWRARVREQAGNLDGAVADYRQALILAPQLDSVPFMLSSVLDRLGRPCEAVLPIEQYLHFRPSERSAPALAERLNRLLAQGGCDHSEGEAVVPFPSGASVILVQTQVSAAAPASFVLDTGASWTILDAAYAREAGLDPASGSEVFVHTALGLAKARYLVADRIAVQGLVAQRVPVAVVDEVPGEARGLLGLSFLSRFEVQIDPAASEVRLRAR